MIEDIFNSAPRDKVKDRSLNRGDHLISKGKVEKYIYLVRSGAFRVYLEDNNEEHTIRFGYKGTVFTALDSFLTGKPTQYVIEAIKKSKVLMLEKDYFQEKINNNPDNQRMYRMLMEQLVIQQMEREVDLLIASPEERYKRVLKRSPHLFQEIPGKYIASYLRMTPETLSRLKKS